MGFHEGAEKVVAAADYHFPGLTWDSDLSNRKLHRVSVYLHAFLALGSYLLYSLCQSTEEKRVNFLDLMALLN